MELTHLQLVLVLLVHPGQQLGLASVQGVDEGVALSHQARLELHAVLLQEETHTEAGPSHEERIKQAETRGNLKQDMY